MVELKSLHVHDLFYVLTSTLARATANSTNRQEIKDFHFQTDSRIGLEIEIAHGKVS